MIFNLNLKQLREVSNRYKNHHITAFSAQMAFFLFLSIFPFAMFILSLTSRLNLNVESILFDIKNGMPEETHAMLTNLVTNYLINDSISLLSLSGIAAIWSASRGVNALIRAFNMAYGHEEKRNFIRLKLTAMFYTLVLIISVIVTIALPSIGAGFFDFFNQFIPIPPYVIDLFYFIRLLLSIVVYVFFIISIHKVLPAGYLKYKDTLAGALFSIVGWLFLSRVFNLFVRTFTNYAAVYGGLASIVTLMMWFYCVSTVMMLGAEINSTIIAFKNKEYPFDENLFVDKG